MGTLFSLSLATSITMSLMWFAYRMIRTSISDGRPQINRAIILGIYLLSLLSMPVGRWIKSFSTHPAYSLAVAGDHAASINMVALPAVATPYINERAAETHWDIMLAIYVAGFALAAILTLLSFLHIIIVCLQSEKVMVAGYRVYLTDKRQFSPFCIGRCIVMSRNDFETCRDNIMYHELGHIKNHHTADRVMAQIIAIICWYCPVAWILRRELTSVHEFQADSYVVDNGVDIKTYVQNYRTDLVLTTDSAGHRSVVNTSGIPLAVTDRAIFVDSKPVTTQELDSINADRIMSFVVDRTLAQPASVYIVTLKPDDLESEK